MGGRMCLVVSNSLPPHGLQSARFFCPWNFQDYWSGFPFPTPGELPNLRIKQVSLVSRALAGGFFLSLCHLVRHKTAILPFEMC